MTDSLIPTRKRFASYRHAAISRWSFVGRLVVVLSLTLAISSCKTDAQRDAEARISQSSARRAEMQKRRWWKETRRYKQLVRAELTAQNKQLAVALTQCEMLRVWDVLGFQEGQKALAEAESTVYRTRAESLAQRNEARELAGTEVRAFLVPACDSIRATWPPLDTTIDPYPGPR